MFNVTPAAFYLTVLVFIVGMSVVGTLVLKIDELKARNAELYQLAMLRGAQMGEKDELIEEQEQIIAQLDRDVQEVDMQLQANEHYADEDIAKLKAEVARLTEQLVATSAELQDAYDARWEAVGKVQDLQAKLDLVERLARQREEEEQEEEEQRELLDALDIPF